MVDDGSTDDTAEVVASVADERVRLLEGPRVGRPSVVRNRALAEVRGVWVAFLDSDDRWRPEKLEQQLGAHDAAGHARWSYTGRRLIGADGQVLSDARFVEWRPTAGWILPALLKHDAMIALPTVMVEAELLIRLGGFDESLELAEDYELWLRLAQHSVCLCVDMPLTDVRLHTGNTTRHNPVINRSYAEVYRRLAGTHPERMVRRVCRHQQAYYLAFLAGQLRDRGDRVASLSAALRGVAAAPTSKGAWWSLAKAALAPGGPERAATS